MRSATDPRRDGTAGDSPASWRRAGELLTAAIELDAAERRAFVERECGDDAALLEEVLSLLEAHERAGPLDRLAAALDAATAETPADAASPGDAVGHYRVLDRLGGGGMGIVYRAHDERLDRAVALKFLSPALAADPDGRARFLAEARAAAALEHPNLCTVHEIGEADDGRLFIAMPLYAGRTIDAMLAAGALPPARALALARQVCDGLAKAHDHGIVHSDVKSANLMVTDDGVVQILDFGIASIGRSAAAPRSAAGTAAYMSPEQAAGDAVDHRTDLWSLGVVLYEMLTGVRPFDGESWPALRDAILRAEPRPAAELRPELPPMVDTLLARALAKDRVARYDSARELASELDAVREWVGGDDGAAVRAAAAPAGTRVERAEPSRADAVPRGGELRPATVLVATTTGFSGLIGRVPDADVERLRRRLHRVVEATVRRHGGTVERCGGGLLVAVFGVPAAREDDALRAVRAARELDGRIAVAAGRALGVATGLRVRAGVHAGRIVARPAAPGATAPRVSGAALHAARRLAGAAPPGGVLIGPAARRLVAPFFHTEPAVTLALDADAEPLTAWRVVGTTGVETRLEAAVASGLTPFAGRDHELRLLHARLERARTGEGQFVSVCGEAGVGKSRLLREFERRLEAADVAVVRGRCRAYGGRAAYRPFREAVRRLLGPDETAPAAVQAEQAVAALRRVAAELEPVIPLCLHLLSLPSEAHPLPGHLRGEHFRAAMLDALGAIFTLSARRRPTVLLFEDWHEADDASSQVLRRLLELAPAYPLLIVVTHRPTATVDWGDPPVHSPLRLGPLDASAADAIVRAVLGAGSVPAELRHALRDRADGNPFFLEELCRTLREGGAVTVEDGRARVHVAADAIELPETVEGVIRTRLDRVDADAREALRIASVIGREFDGGVLANVLPDERRFTRCLERLTELRMVHPVRVLPTRTYRFQHALTRDVAYASLLEPQRRRLHGRVGRALEAMRAERRDELLEDLAHHFGQAREWSKAAAYAREAAERAVGLSEFGPALELLNRTRRWLAELPASDETRERVAGVLFRQERICETIGLRARQQRIIDELFELLGDGHDRARLADAHRRQGDLHTLGRGFDDAAASLARALRLSRALGDADRERNTRRSIGLLRWQQGRYDAAIRQVERALVIDRARGDAEAIAGDLANLGNVLRSRGDHQDALRRLEEALTYAERAGNRIKQVYTLHAIGNVHRSLGDDDEALRSFEAARNCTTEHRLAIPYSFHLTAIAHIRLERGEIDESLRLYREAVDVARRAQHADGLSHALRIFGDVLYGLGRHDEALPRLEEAAALFARLGGRAGEMHVRTRLAAIHEAANRHDAALEVWTRVRWLALRPRDDARELEAAEGIARTLRRAGDVGRALDAYREAAALAASIGRSAREAALRNTLGIIEWERGEYDAALAEYEAALEAFDRTTDRVGPGLILNSIGVTLSGAGRHQEAVARLERATSLNRENGQRRWEAHGLAALADAHEALGDAAQARACLERSLEIRRDVGDRIGEGWMLHDLARLEFAAGGAAGARALAEDALEIAAACDDARLLAACRRLRRA